MVRKSHRKNLSMEEEYGYERAVEIKKKIRVKTKEAMARPEIRKKIEPTMFKGQIDEYSEKNPNWKGGKLKRICENCKKGFYTYKKVQKYCSRLCCVMGRDKSKTEFKKGHIPWNKGIKRFDIIGKKNGRWLGGKSFEPYGLEFNKELKEKIRNEYNRICQLCNKGENGSKLAVHHIDYDKKNNSIKNLIPLHINCHLKTNVNRDYWINFFKNKEVKDEFRFNIRTKTESKQNNRNSYDDSRAFLCHSTV